VRENDKCMCVHFGQFSMTIDDICMPRLNDLELSMLHLHCFPTGPKTAQASDDMDMVREGERGSGRSGNGRGGIACTI
jgi:hypothetical protein